MASMKIPVYRCPYCNKKLPSNPVNDYCAIKTKYYGNPYTVCKKCGKTYYDRKLIEPAAALTLKEVVPFWATSIWTITALVMLAIFSCGIGLVVLVPAYLLFCFLSRNYRQKHKNDLLMASRARLRDPDDFLRHLHSEVYLPDKSKLTPEALAIIYTRALAVMDADEVLEVGPIMRSMIGK